MDGEGEKTAVDEQRRQGRKWRGKMDGCRGDNGRKQVVLRCVGLIGLIGAERFSWVCGGSGSSSQAWWVSVSERWGEVAVLEVASMRSCAARVLQYKCCVQVQLLRTVLMHHAAPAHFVTRHSFP
jgi:hypothetical protein